MIKKIFFSVLLAAFIVSGCSTGKPVHYLADTYLQEKPEKVNTNGVLLEGQWSYECDVLGFNRFTWVSSIEFEFMTAVVEISFDDLDVVLGEYSDLAFILYSPDPEYKFNWLHIEKDGSYNPELMYFDEFGPMEIYPGGYEMFEEELREKGIDWPMLYQKTKAEFLSQFLSMDEYCIPNIIPNIPDSTPEPNTESATLLEWLFSFSTSIPNTYFPITTINGGDGENRTPVLKVKKQKCTSLYCIWL